MKVDTCFVMDFNQRATNLPIAHIGMFIVATNSRNGTSVLFLCVLGMR